MENSFFPIVAGLLADLDSPTGIIQSISMVVCLASLLGAMFQGLHERSVGGVKTALTIAAVAGLAWTIVTAFYTAGGFSANIQPNAGAVN
jgi:predicted Na+-dependent transporter